ncbi:LamG domain-containing protein [Christiangramia salexigens]|uniref:LamG-like jellyroll fold domain-containing protein n=1 Tax=Christiangramia salexigens TaxID=1913577 RepID=A0A1L3J5D6_9FLAO|nr:LamG domain-containing protein [Christiangramia salexigens]APG60345.1 hypothetical protein LPB144_07975 [Christiangramia salexigens]
MDPTRDVDRDGSPWFIDCDDNNADLNDKDEDNDNYSTCQGDPDDQDPNVYPGSALICINQTVTAAQTSFICEGETTINLGGSQTNVSYYLRNNADNSIIDGPIAGTGSPISFNTGTISSNTTFNVYSEAGAKGALDFDGIDDQVILDGFDLAGEANVTIEAWVNPTDVTGAHKGIISKTNGDGQFIFRLENGHPRSVFYTSTGDLGSLSTQALTPGQWYHVVTTFDGDESRIYVNGVDVTGAQYNYAASGGLKTYTASPAIIGRANPQEFFDGKIGEVRVWNELKTPAEITANMSSSYTGTETGLVALYKMKEGKGITVADSTGSFDGTMENMDPATDWLTYDPDCTLEMTDKPSVTIAPIEDQVVTVAESTLCPSNTGTTVNLETSQPDITYYLRNDADDSIIDGPVEGGGAISFDTGSITTTTNYNVHAVPTNGDTSCSTQMSQTVAVTIEDNTAPTVIARDITVQLDENGQATITADQVNNGSTDNCTAIGNLTLSLDKSTFSCADISSGGECGEVSLLFNSSGIATGDNNANVEELGMNQLTMEAWVKPSSNVVNSVIRKAGDYDLYIYDGQLKAEVWYKAGSDASMYQFTGPAITYNAWSHVAFVYDNTNPGVGYFVVNGNTYPSNGNAHQIGSNGNLGIGSSTVYGQSFNGLIDEVRIWSVARTAQNIQDNLSGCITGSELGLEAYYKVQEGSGSVLKDFSDNGNDLTIQGATWQQEGGTTAGVPVTLTVGDANGNQSTATANVAVVDIIAPIIRTYEDILVELDENGQASIRGDYSVGPVAGKLEPQNSLSTTTPVDCDCPEGYVAVGYEGASGWILDDFRLVCKEVLADGGLGTETVETCFSGSRTEVTRSDMLTGNEVLVGFEVQDGDFQHQLSSRTHVGVKGFGKSLDQVVAGNQNNIDNTALAGIIGSGTGTTSLATTTNFAPAGHAIVGMSVNQTSGYSSSVSFKYAPISSLLSIDNGSTDNCGIASITADKYSFTCENIGENIVTITAMDVNGNEASATAVVTVEDNTAPQAIVRNITVELDANGMASITPEMVDNGSSDNCATTEDLQLILDKSIFGCEDVVDKGVTPNLSALNFDGDDYVSIPDSPELQLQGDMTIEAWFKVDEFTGDWVRVVGKGAGPEGPVGPRNYGLWYFPNGTWLFQQYGQGVQVAFNRPIDIGEWYHMAAVKTGNVAKLYINGEVVASNTGGTNPITSNDPLTIGYAGFHDHHIGQIDEVRLWNIARTDEEILNDFTKTINPETSGLLAYYNMEEASGDILNDQTVNGFNGDLQGFSQNEAWTGSSRRLGPVSTMLTVTDASGNSSSSTAVVTVVDNIAATVVTQNITVALDENGTATITPEMIDGGSSDNCEIASLELDVTEFTCENVGENTVTLTAVDVNDNESSATAVVTVEDNIPAEVLTQNITVQLDDMGMASITPEMIDNGSNDVCGIASMSLDITDFTCENVGENMVTLTAVDVNDNEASATATVIVEDNIAATVVTQNITVALDENGTATITPEMIDNGSNDVCGIASLSLDITDFTCENVGENTVTLTAVDVNDNEASATATVIVEDKIAAEVLTQNITVQLDEMGMASITPEMIDNDSNDVCGIASLSLDITDFTCENVGENTVTLTAVDVNDNEASATATVIVEDKIAAEVLTQNITVQLDELGMASITPEMIDNGSNDACGIASMSLDITDFTCENVGENTVTLTAVDVNDNEASATATVIVEDKIAAEVLTQNITVQLDDMGMASITPEMINNGSNDVCGIASMSLDITDFTCENVGENTVTLTVVDVNDNEASATATVIVEDKIAAEVLTQNITVQLDEMGMASITPEMIDNGSNDACGIASMSLDITDFTCENVGENIVTLTAMDVNDNEASATVIVTVEDKIAAEVLTQNITVQLDEMGMASITPEMIDNGSNDACGIVSMSLDITDFTCENVGENIVTLTAMDVNDNEASATAIVTVEDKIAAEVITQNITVQLDEMGMASITPEMIDNGSNDACGIASMSLDKSDFTCDHIGENTVTLTAIDIHGNESSATAIVSVEDVIAPTPVMDQLEPIYAECIVERTDVPTPLATDNCDIEISATTDLVFPVTRQGSTMIRWKFEDSNANVTYQQQKIIIDDITAPVPDIAELETVEVECGVTAISAPTATDNCAGSVTGTTTDPLSYEEQGDYEILWTFDDGNGNSTTQIQQVIVKDQTPPVALAKDITVVLDPNDNVRINPEDIDDGSYDECSEISLSLDRDYFTSNGSYEVVLTVTDALGNSSEASARVIVVTNHPETSNVHVVPTILKQSSMAKVIVPFRSRIIEVQVLETETNKYKIIRGNKLNEQQIDIAPFKGTLLVRIIDQDGRVHLKKLIAL